MPTAQVWAPGHTPTAAPGLKVNAFATGLDHPRWIQTLPTGDVLIAEAMSEDRPPRSVFDYAMVSTMRRAAAMGVSANRITLLRDADGAAETREVFPERQNQPFGMALVGETFYVGNTDGIVDFPYTPGAARLTGPAELDLASGTSRIFASGLRNAVGMASEPVTGALWTVVNERDGLGDETPPGATAIVSRRR